METNGVGAATPCGGCAACQSRLVVTHEVGRDTEGAKCKWQPSANVLTLLVAGTCWEAVGSCGRGEPQIVDCAAVTAVRGVVLADKLADGWRQATHGAERAAVVVIMVSCSSSTVWL